jgi:hypothetical protein
MLFSFPTTIIDSLEAKLSYYVSLYVFVALSLQEVHKIKTILNYFSLLQVSLISPKLCDWSENCYWKSKQIFTGGKVNFIIVGARQ